MLDKMIRYFDREVAKLERDIEGGRLTPQELLNNATTRCIGVASFCLANDVPLVEVLRAYDDTMVQMLKIFNMASASKKNRRG